MIKKVQGRIESVAFKGYGVARIHDKVAFIPHTVTGDEVWIEMIEEKKRYSMGRLVRIVEPSPWRVTPPCPSFGECGGCQWQHIDYSFQVKLKEEILKDLLNRFGGVKELPPVCVFPSPKPYAYRVRVQWKVYGKAMGYFREKSHHVADIQKCPVAHPLINRMLPWVRKMSSSFSQIKETELNVSPDENKGVLILHSLAFERGTERILKEFLRNHAMFKGIAIAKEEENILFGDPALNLTISLDQEEEKKNLTFRISPGSFSQVNPGQNQTLIQTALDFSEVSREETLLDLYAGVGNLTLPLAMGARKVFGIEENGRAIEDARFNAKRNEIRNCDFIHGRVEEVLMHWRREIPDLIVLDPPRTGCKTVLDQMVRLKPEKIVYISCEPTTFSRDLRLFTEKGYSLHKLGLIDMFPQTYHMEVIGLLQKG